MNKVFFYHGVPDDLEGDELIPLTEIFKKRPDLHAKYLEKYKGREEILQRRIPLLDCGWNDVVQLLPLHPRQLFELQQRLGLIEELPEYHYFEIDPASLDPNRTVVYFKTAPGDENVTVQWLNDVDMSSLQQIPQATEDYYRSMVGTGEPVFNYQFVPHVVCRGSVDITDSRTVIL